MGEAYRDLVAFIARLTDSPRRMVGEILSHPWTYYRPATVRKKRSGTRKIRAPSDDLKAIQRTVLQRVLTPLEEHPANYCRRGFSVIKNAELHVRSPYVVAFDLHKAFPSTRPHMVLAALRRAHFEPTVARAVTRLCTLKRELPQGAPTSPALLSAVLHPLDDTLWEESLRQGIRYTRYVDDLFVSSGRRLRSFEAIIGRAVRDAGYRVAEEKTERWGPNQRATLAGVVLGSTFSPTPEFMRSVESMVRKLESGELALSESQTAQLEGMVAWVRALDLRRGEALRARLLAARNPQKWLPPAQSPRYDAIITTGLSHRSRSHRCLMKASTARSALRLAN